MTLLQAKGWMSTLCAPLRPSPSSFSTDELRIFSIWWYRRNNTVHLSVYSSSRLFALVRSSTGLFVAKSINTQNDFVGYFLLPVDLSPLCLRKFRRVMPFCLHCTLIGRVGRIVDGIFARSFIEQIIAHFGSSNSSLAEQKSSYSKFLPNFRSKLL